jgi:small redox-active disulfide protein 2
MKNIKVLGIGCTKCSQTYKMISETAHKLGVEIELEKVEKAPDIVKFGVMTTPAVVIDGKVVHAGGLPKHEQIETWLKS